MCHRSRGQRRKSKILCCIFCKIIVLCENVLYTFRSAKNLFAGESFDSDIVLGQLEVCSVLIVLNLNVNGNHSCDFQEPRFDSSNKAQRP